MNGAPPRARAAPRGSGLCALLVAVAFAAWLAFLVAGPWPTTLRLELRTEKPTPVALLLFRSQASPPDRIERALEPSVELQPIDWELPGQVIGAIQLEIPPGAAVTLGRTLLLDGDEVVFEAAPRAAGRRAGVRTRVADGLSIAAGPDAPAVAILRVELPVLARGSALRQLQWLTALLAAMAALVAWRAHRRRGAPPDSSRRAGIVVTLAGAIAVVVTVAAARMAYGPERVFHPDEIGHVVAAEYYVDHLGPSPVGSRELEPTIMLRWGRSYLFEIDVVYAFAGRFAAFIGDASARPLRLFQLLLLASLLAVAAWRAPRHPALFAAMAATPQAWYVFAYFNADAFPLALSFAAAFLLAPAIRDGVARAEPLGRLRTASLGVVLGLLAVSKANYRIAVAGFLALLAVAALAPEARPVRRTVLARAAVAGAIAAAIFGLRWLQEEAINGFEKQERIEAFVEAHSDPAFTRTAAREGAGLPERFARDRGETLADLFVEGHWLGRSFESAVGVYGQSAAFAPKAWYAAIGALVVVALATLGALAWRTGAAPERRLLLLAALVAAAVVGQSVWHSWTYDNQPMGRYLFPMLPFGAIAFDPLLRRSSIEGVALVYAAGAGLSLWSFVHAGIGQLT